MVLRVAFVVSAVGLLVAVGLFLGPWVGASAIALLRSALSGFVWIVQALADGVDVWTIVVRASASVGRVLATPRVTLAFVGAELLGVAALYGLHRVLTLEKEKTKW